jgi:hypothetical protein
MRWLNLAHIIAEANMTDKKTGLELLREPFPAHQISRLPKPTANQTAEVKADFKKGIRCKECGAWHHKDVVHLDYVGHAALTDRLLDCDPAWNWEPMGVDAFGQPAFSSQGLWIRLTVCGVTRLGFGDAQDKKGPNAIKEMIGDALRNAAMRFGAALDLWHKGDLHVEDTEINPNWEDSLKASKNRAEFERAYKAIPAETRPQFAELAKEIGAKYPKLEVAA